MSNWLQQGYDAVDEEVVKSEMKMQEFRVSAGETARIRFLDEEPLSFRQHNFKLDGKWPKYTCRAGLDGGCPLCAAENSARFVGVYSIYDYGWRKNIRTGKETNSTPGVKVYVQGIRVLKVLSQLHEREGGLRSQDFEVTRSGSGTDTIYNFIPLTPTDFPAGAKDESGNLNRINLREKYAPLSVGELQKVAVRIKPPQQTQTSAGAGQEVFSSDCKF
jgi:hypothetical protein